MAETVILDVPLGDWIELSHLVGHNARVTNITEHILIWRKSITKPDSGDYDGHRVRDTNPFDYSLNAHVPELIWVRAHKQPVRIAVTPDIAQSSFRGAIDIHDACVHRVVYNQFLHYDTATATTLAAPVSTGSNVITVTDPTGFVVGAALKIENGSQEPVFPRIVIIAGSVFTLDTPITFDHPAGADVVRVRTNLADPSFTTATVTSPIVFTSHVPHASVVHVTSMSVVMTSSSAMDFAKFGSLSTLPNGLVLRAYSDGQLAHFTNWKQNLDIDSDAFPVRYQVKTGGGEYGLAALYNIKEATESVVYLDGAKIDRFEALIQDNLTGLSTFRIKLQGHYEGM